jgi:hypothetical protein
MWYFKNTITGVILRLALDSMPFIAINGFFFLKKEFEHEKEK